MDRRPLARVVLALAVVVAGCATTGGRPDPDRDRVGWEDGYWYDDPIAVEEEDALDRRELRTLVDRTTARVERIRGEEFEGDVEVEVLDRERYRDREVFSPDPDPWEDQVWEALFLVGEDERAADAFGRVYGGAVRGYYTDDRIVLVAGDEVRVDPATLAHELTHAF
jgi:hypothetical protein